jgi:hypothetical protein
VVISRAFSDDSSKVAVGVFHSQDIVLGMTLGTLVTKTMTHCRGPHMGSNDDFQSVGYPNLVAALHSENTKLEFLPD